MSQKYSDNFDTLVALITHLSSTHRASRTPTYISKNLSLEKSLVIKTLEEFPAFFRKSKKVSTDQESEGDYFYTVHLRYSRRKLDKNENGESQPLSADEITTLLNVVTSMVSQEQETSRTIMELKENYKSLFKTNIATMVAAIVAAIGAIAAALLSGSN